MTISLSITFKFLQLSFDNAKGPFNNAEAVDTMFKSATRHKNQPTPHLLKL